MSYRTLPTLALAAQYPKLLVAYNPRICNAVYMAKLAEQAERYDEMVEEMKKVLRVPAQSRGTENLSSDGHAAAE